MVYRFSATRALPREAAPRAPHEVNSMTPRLRNALFLLPLLAACAAPGKPPAPLEQHQADERPPGVSAFPPGDIRVVYSAPVLAEQSGEASEVAGKAAEAQRTLAEAAAGYVAFLEKYPRTGWSLPVRYHAAELLVRAGRIDEAVAQAERIAANPDANPKSRAMAWLLAANALVKAGKLEPLKIVPAEDRGGKPPSPRPPEGAWKRFADALDAHVATAGAEPADRIVTTAQLVAVGAQVAFALDDMPAARARVTTILDRWPGEGTVFESVAGLLVQTHLVAGDPAGAVAALDKVRTTAGAQLAKAADAKAKEPYERIVAEADRIGASLRFQAAKASLDQGKAAEAAKAFEAVAAMPSADAAAALNAASIAWDRAGDEAAAAALRQRILDQHGDSWAAPGAMLQLAIRASQKGEQAEAARLFGEHAKRWPDDPNHCVSARNAPIAAEAAKRNEEAADGYLAFGKDAACAKATPDAAALAAYRAGRLYLVQKKQAAAKEAFQTTVSVEGVTQPEAKERVADAKKRLRRL